VKISPAKALPRFRRCRSLEGGSGDKLDLNKYDGNGRGRSDLLNKPGCRDAAGVLKCLFARSRRFPALFEFSENRSILSSLSWPLHPGLKHFP
jgi:hypothetical protein